MPKMVGLKPIGAAIIVKSRQKPPNKNNCEPFLPFLQRVKKAVRVLLSKNYRREGQKRRGRSQTGYRKNKNNFL